MNTKDKNIISIGDCITNLKSSIRLVATESKAAKIVLKDTVKELNKVIESLEGS